jgi:hypothetical protein
MIAIYTTASSGPPDRLNVHKRVNLLCGFGCFGIEVKGLSDVVLLELCCAKLEYRPLPEAQGGGVSHAVQPNARFLNLSPLELAVCNISDARGVDIKLQRRVENCLAGNFNQVHPA